MFWPMKNLGKIGLIFLAIVLAVSTMAHADPVSHRDATAKQLTGSITTPSRPARSQNLLAGVFAGETGAELLNQVPRPDSPGTDTSNNNDGSSNRNSSTAAKKAWYLIVSPTLLRSLSIEVLLFPFHFFF